ncbi:peptidase, M16 family protein [Algoriphagus sp. AGSA1]|uniref:peptidase, M16 family protein n=1 Tax=Algoriphagus sp. AGSA1 TaxID=2907213 RepID=UPI001F3E0838|nr:peptidase, M16 family protein [Algoriphagus sp. AGSA1]MCE7055612.1 peptidase, M16 family protein [Algoriphagus sp. AGSA1]
MRKTCIVLALGLLTAPWISFAGEKERPIQVIEENSVEEVIGNYVKAIGGEAKMKSVRTIEMKMQAEVQGMNLEIHSVIDQENQKLLNVTEMNGNVVSKTVIQGGAGQVMAMGQSQDLTEDQLATFKNQMYGFQELHLEELGITVTYDGTEQVEGEEAYKLTFDSGGDTNTTEYYSVATGLKLQTVSKAAGTISYKDYQEVDGLKMPMKLIISNAMLPVPLEAKVTSIKLNKDVDDSLFN